MTFAQLFFKLGKQPFATTNRRQVVAVIDDKEIPLVLKTQPGIELKMWFVVDNNAKQ